jgi:hypothetical protein
VYSDEVQIGPETVMTTLYTAKKYAVPALEKHCVDFLKRNLSPDNAFMLLTQVSTRKNMRDIRLTKAKLPVMHTVNRGTVYSLIAVQYENVPKFVTFLI